MVAVKRQIELFELVKETLRTDIVGYDTGICQVIHGIHLQDKCNKTEYLEILHTLRINKPTSRNQFKKFYKNVNWVTGVYATRGYWWEEINQEPETRQIRIDYLTALIENLKSK